MKEISLCFRVWLMLEKEGSNCIETLKGCNLKSKIAQSFTLLINKGNINLISGSLIKIPIVEKVLNS